MKFLFIIGAIVILIGTPLSVIALGKKQGCVNASAGCAAGSVAAKGKTAKRRAGEVREIRRARAQTL